MSAEREEKVKMVMKNRGREKADENEVGKLKNCKKGEGDDLRRGRKDK